MTAGQHHSKAPVERMSHQSLIIFDGACNLCHHAVHLIIKLDKAERFVFASAQSRYAQEQLQLQGLCQVAEHSLVLINSGQACTFSDAAIEIAKGLAEPWPKLALLAYLPKPFRDAVYRLIARSRYRLFGKRKQCERMPQHLKHRFMDLD